MAITSTHPLYDEFSPDWVQLRDTYKGERQVKAKRFVYLPPTSGMIEDGVYQPNANAATQTKGFRAYEAMRTRAKVPDLMREAVENVIGVMHNKPPEIKLPAQMEYLRLRATDRGESLEMLLRRINEEQCVLGRVGLLGDVSTLPGREGEVFVSLRVGERIKNWDEGQLGADQRLDLVVLDDTQNKREKSELDWVLRTQHRVLMLRGALEGETAAKPSYQFQVVQEGNDLSSTAWGEPAIRGRKAEEIPFVFINTKDVVPEPDRPQLLGISNDVLSIYRSEADYRQALHMQGQDTLVVKGGTAGTENADGTTNNGELRTGAGARIDLPIEGDADYIGVHSEGLPEMRTALENDYKAAGAKVGQLLDSVSRERESGDALKVRVAARTATLNNIAAAGAYGLEQLLKILARWMGANPEEVEVIPNLDFVDDTMEGKELVDIISAKAAGAPYSLKSIHALMVKRGMTEMQFEEEIEEIEKESELNLTPPPSTAPEGPVDEDGNPIDPEQDPNAPPKPPKKQPAVAGV